MLYYLDIQQLALQQAGGQTGPAARAAAVELMDKLPHSVVAARCDAGLNMPLLCDYRLASPSAQTTLPDMLHQT
jgi:hypothetical protein